ncbi:MAG TPA: hypothetical protein VLG14_16310 [Sphingomonas sp.]|nr:hypothetical protein [Sphingomonas sp.]
MLILAAALAATSVAGTVQGAAPASTLQPSADAVQDRIAMREFSKCLAKARPRWARKVLAQPYLSKDQTDLLESVNGGRDNCTGGSSEITLRYTSIITGLAEQFIAEDVAQVGWKRVSAALVRVPSRNASEDFALCVAARRAKAAQDLVLSRPGSAAERNAGEQLAQAIKPCTNPNESGIVDLQSLRALAATALYRGVIHAIDPSSKS